MGVRRSTMVLAVAMLLATAVSAVAESPCTQRADCGANEYCDHPLGQCRGSGTCRAMLFSCPNIWNPACGCDGESYESECTAEAQGIDVAHLGSCCLGACRSLDRVTVEDLTIGVAQGLGLQAPLCHSFDRDQNGRITIDELTVGIRNAMRGCPR